METLTQQDELLQKLGEYDFLSFQKKVNQSQYLFAGSKLFACEISNEYVIIVCGETPDGQSININECPSHTLYTVNFISNLEYQNDENPISLTRTASYKILDRFMGVDAQTPVYGHSLKSLLEILESCGAKKKAGIAANPIKINTCTECGGTKIIDLGFYQRKCMRCFEG